jgi:hypothetical protein
VIVQLVPSEKSKMTYSRNKNLCLDDPKLRQNYTKYMTAKEKERFAKSYVHSLLETKEEILRFRRMANPSLHKIYKDTYESGGMVRCEIKQRK